MTNEIKESFFDLRFLRESNTECITKQDVDIILRQGARLHVIVGQGYDGASVMSSEQAGVQAMIRRKAKTVRSCIVFHIYFISLFASGLRKQKQAYKVSDVIVGTAAFSSKSPS